MDAVTRAFLEYLRNGLRYLFFQLTFMGFAQDVHPWRLRGQPPTGE